jgi:transposase
VRVSEGRGFEPSAFCSVAEIVSVGKRPTRERQDEFGNAYIFGVACPDTGQSHFLVASEIGSEFMQLFLNSFAKTLGRKVNALLVLDNASWHTSQRLVVPSNITLHPLPPYAPDLHPIENLWLFMKMNYLCNRVYRNSKQILEIGVYLLATTRPWA